MCTIRKRRGCLSLSAFCQNLKNSFLEPNKTLNLYIEKVCDNAILRYVITYFMVVLLLVVGMKLYRKCEQIVMQREIK